MPFHPVLEAFGGNLKIVGTGASTANQHMPHFADDIAVLPEIPLYNSSKSAPNRPLRGRRGRFRALLQQLQCGILERTAVLY